jgi:hypothetical protein
LEANLKAIADGRAGEQDYWNLSEIPNFDSIQLAQSLQDSSWVDGVTGGVTKTTSVSYIDGKYAIGGYTSLDTVYFGMRNNLDPFNFDKSQSHPFQLRKIWTEGRICCLL